MRSKSPQTDADFGSRRKRREAVNDMVVYLTAIREAEQAYLKNVPVNLQCSESFEVGECAVDALDEIIDLMIDVY